MSIFQTISPTTQTCSGPRPRLFIKPCGGKTARYDNA